MTAVIEDALRERLARPQSREVREPTRLPTVSGSGLVPGVGLDDSAGLRNLMDASA
jgi:hypothetical protein